MLVREGRKIRRNTRRVFESDEQRLLKSYNKYKKMYDRDWDFGVFGIDSAADLFAIVESIDELIEEINDSTINNKNKIIDDLIKFRDDASSLGDSIEDEEESADYDDEDDDDDDDVYESYRCRRESPIRRCSRLEKKSLVRKGNRIVRTEVSRESRCYEGIVSQKPITITSLVVRHPDFLFDIHSFDFEIELDNGDSTVALSDSGSSGRALAGNDSEIILGVNYLNGGMPRNLSQATNSRIFGRKSNILDTDSIIISMENLRVSENELKIHKSGGREIVELLLGVSRDFVIETKKGSEKLHLDRISLLVRDADEIKALKDLFGFGNNEARKVEASVPGGVDEDWVIELSHYAAEVKRNQISYLVKNLAKKSNKGIELSVDRLASSSVIDQILRDAIKEYNREYGEEVRISTATRKAAKQELAEIIMQMVGEEKE